MEKFVARQNLVHYRHELEQGADGTRRVTLLRLLLEELNHLGLTREQLGRLDHHIARLGGIMARQVELIDGLRLRGKAAERPEMVLTTLNDLMATYLAHRQSIAAALA